MSSVDLPTPGSPPIRTRLPATMPPPRTRLSSPQPRTPWSGVSAGKLCERDGPRRLERPWTGVFGRLAHLKLLERVPGVAVRALAGPAQAFATALGADEGGRGLRHRGKDSEPRPAGFARSVVSFTRGRRSIH